MYLDKNMVLRDDNMLVLDTNILIEIENNNYKIIDLLKQSIGEFSSNPVITAPSYTEFLYGVLDKPELKKQRSEQFLDDFDLLHTSKNSSRLLANIKYKLEKAGKMIPIFDLFVASIVMDNSATLVTMDEHFKNIEGMRLIIIDQDYNLKYSKKK